MQITDNLFLSVSQKLGVRVTPENLRTKMEDVSSYGGITAKVKTDILIELMLTVVELDKRINEK